MDKSSWAEHMLRDEWFQEMMQELRSAEINKFATSAVDDVNVREAAYYQLQALDSVENYLEGIVSQKLIEGKRLKIL
jgi:histone H3/H4